MDDAGLRTGYVVVVGEVGRDGPREAPAAFFSDKEQAERFARDWRSEVSQKGLGSLFSVWYRVVEVNVHERTCHDEFTGKPTDIGFKCSACGGVCTPYWVDFCPWCGARVVEEDSDDK